MHACTRKWIHITSKWKSENEWNWRKYSSPRTFKGCNTKQKKAAVLFRVVSKNLVGVFCRMKFKCSWALIWLNYIWMLKIPNHLLINHNYQFDMSGKNHQKKKHVNFFRLNYAVGYCQTKLANKFSNRSMLVFIRNEMKWMNQREEIWAEWIVLNIGISTFISHYVLCTTIKIKIENRSSNKQ